MEDVAPANTLEKTVASATAHFEQRYGKWPQWIAAAPGRVNIIGEHVDYNDGFVLPMAIDRYCVIVAGQTTGQVATVYSATADDEAKIALESPRPDMQARHWSNYFAGVLAGFAKRGLRPSGFNALIDSGVPIGGGLSSSASLEVAAATLLEAMMGVTLDPIEKALLCQKAEHDFAGVPCGIMDQFASAMCREDHLMLLDCRSQTVEHVPFLDPAITVLIVNTNVKHELSGGEYAERRRQCESAARKLGVASLRDAAFPQLQARRRFLEPVEYRRAKHVVSEIARTARAAAAVKAGDWPLLGQLMYASHTSLRDDYEVSCRELDVLVDLAKDIGPGGGVIGSRMTGGGFGGCTVSLIETKKADAVASQLLQRYREATGIEASSVTSRPARGAHVISNHEDGAE